MLFGVVCLSGCVSTRIEYFTEESYPPQQEATAVEWLSVEPSSPHMELARIVVSSVNADQDTLQKTLLERARSLGADAVIAEPPLVVTSPARRPYYEPGILGPAGSAFSFYGYGWYSPYTSNPYLFSQGATDQPSIEHVLAGTAIRYENAPLTGAP